ncbi:MAG: hypothetical protein GWN58_61315, partial [Anaerolineae bacterium]|nr:hypothetical protein [Anaerolineae bacterium]
TEPPAPTADPATDGMPEGGVEKFWNAETKEYNWEADAKEKAWQLSQKEKTAPAAENTETIPAEGEENNLPDSAEQIAEAAGLDLQAVNEAILETGQFPAEAMEALKSVFPTLTAEDLEGYSAYLHDTVAN